jgi:uncharacterized membrane protein (DUF485 family)
MKDISSTVGIVLLVVCFMLAVIIGYNFGYMSAEIDYKTNNCNVLE